MLDTCRRLLELLTPAERRRGYLLLAMILVMAMLDMLGVASIMPFITVLAAPDTVLSNPYLARVYSALDMRDVDSFLFLLGVAAFVALVVAIAVKGITTYAIVRFGQMRMYSMSRRLVEAYVRQPYEFFLNRHSADLGKNILLEVHHVVVSGLMPMMHLVAQLAVVLAILSLLVLIDPTLAVVVAVALGGAYGAVYVLIRKYLSRIGAGRLEANRERVKTVQETFGGIKDIKFSGLEAAAVDRFQGPAQRYARFEAAAAGFGLLPRYAMEIIAFGGILAVTLFLMGGESSGPQHALPVLAVYAFAGYRLMPAMQALYGHLTSLRFATSGVASLHADLVALASTEDGQAGREHERPLGLEGELRMEDIVYAYPGASRPALESLTLRLAARTTLGLVGTTGSGKSTTVDLILGLLWPRQGQLIVDGTPITRANLRRWQRSVGYVPQQIYLSDDSLAANIAFGIPAEQIDHAAVERAARVASLHDFVVSELPAGYATHVGERGVRLSGGQRQRVGIARALYHDPDVLIFDEATSALDNLTEQAVMEAVSALASRKTIILVAHRLTTVRDCDSIALLEGGRIVAEGTYESLLDTSVTFRAMAGG